MNKECKHPEESIRRLVFDDDNLIYQWCPVCGAFWDGIVTGDPDDPSLETAGRWEDHRLKEEVWGLRQQLMLAQKEKGSLLVELEEAGLR